MLCCVIRGMWIIMVFMLWVWCCVCCRLCVWETVRVSESTVVVERSGRVTGMRGSISDCLRSSPRGMSWSLAVLCSLSSLGGFYVCVFICTCRCVCFYVRVMCACVHMNDVLRCYLELMCGSTKGDRVGNVCVCLSAQPDYQIRGRIPTASSKWHPVKVCWMP